jgi:hypothetical protein
MFRLELDNVAHAFGRKLHGGSAPGLFRVLVTGHEPRPRSGGEIDEDVASACPDPVHHFAVEREIHARPRGLRIAHMNVDNGRSSFAGIDCRLRDLLRRHRDGGIAAGRVRRARYRA